MEPLSQWKSAPGHYYQEAVRSTGCCGRETYSIFATSEIQDPDDILYLFLMQMQLLKQAREEVKMVEDPSGIVYEPTEKGAAVLKQATKLAASLNKLGVLKVVQSYEAVETAIFLIKNNQ